MKDYYSILGVSKDADEVVIKAAYKALAQKYHPDKSQSESVASNTKLMIEINESYAILGEKNRRRNYDLKYKEYFAKKGVLDDSKANNSNNTHSNSFKDQLIPDTEGWKALGLGFMLFLVALALGILFVK